MKREEDWLREACQALAEEEADQLEHSLDSEEARRAEDAYRHHKKTALSLIRRTGARSAAVPYLKAAAIVLLIAGAVYVSLRQMQSTDAPQNQIPTVTVAPYFSSVPAAEPTAAATMTPTPTIVQTAAPSPAPTAAPTPSPSPTSTIAPTAVPSPTPTKTPTAAPSPTPTITPTATPSPAPSPTPTAPTTPSPSPTPSVPPAPSTATDAPDTQSPVPGWFGDYFRIQKFQTQ